MSLKLKDETRVPDSQLERQRLTSLINSMADGVIAVDESVNIALYNGAALNILDVNNLKAASSLAKHFKPIDKNNQPVDINELVKQAKTPITNRDLRLKYNDGSVINLYLSIAPVHLGYGQKGEKGYVLLLRDITREKSLEDERDEFISVVSHELRTPIAIAEGNISNASFMMSKGAGPDEIKHALIAAHDQILFLADLINDLSTLSRAERGVLEIESSPINVHQLLTQLQHNYQPAANNKGLVLKVEIDPKLELLYSSQLYVKEILQNFITNGLKYTPRGQLTITAKAEPKGVKFVVEDTGIGISKSDQERVFDKFFRSEDYRTRQASGTGLGLYVTIKLARLINAEIALVSELNKGSTFTVFVPNLKST